MLVEQALSNAIYETQKEASLQGRYDEALYTKIKDYLIEIHHFDPEQIQITGTETLTMRGERMYIEIIIPKPNTTVIQAFDFGGSENFHYKKYIMSEYAN
jgi:hypothetical protein